MYAIRLESCCLFQKQWKRVGLILLRYSRVVCNRKYVGVELVINNQLFIRRFVIFTFCVTAIHFILETLYTIQFGQSFLGLLPDLIADTLLVIGGILVLKNSKAIGVLCGAWGFTFCLHYRSWAWRFESVQEGSATSVDEITMIVLASTMFISILCFILTLLMCLPKRD